MSVVQKVFTKTEQIIGVQLQETLIKLNVEMF